MRGLAGHVGADHDARHPAAHRPRFRGRDQLRAEAMPARVVVDRERGQFHRFAGLHLDPVLGDDEAVDAGLALGHEHRLGGLVHDPAQPCRQALGIGAAAELSDQAGDGLAILGDRAPDHARSRSQRAASSAK